METLLGVDLGTTGIKAAICTPQARVLGESYLEYPLIKPRPAVVEQDADLWWELAQTAIRQALKAAGVEGRTVRALSVSSQGISFVPVDEQGQTLCNAINWLDTRATAEAAAISEQYTDADLFALTGKRASPAYVLPKLLWLRNHAPDVFDRAHKYLMGHDYLLYKFSGQYVTDHSMASGTLLYDITGQDWSSELCERFDISPEQLPAIRWSGTPLGRIRRDVAGALGLGEDTIVAVGGQDQKCAALGADIRPRVATISLGTASAISCLTESPTLDPQRRIPTFPFVVPGYWDLEGVVGTAGGAFRWLSETVFQGTRYDDLAALADRSRPGANGVCFFPHLAGAGSPHWRPDVWGAFLGLSLATSPADIVRSVLEGVAFQIRENLDVMESIGIPIDEMILFGGGSQSPLWAQIISDVSGLSATVAEMADVANWGACILAGVAAGIFQGDLFARSMRSGREARYTPNPEKAKRYATLYQDYRAQESKLLA